MSDEPHPIPMKVRFARALAAVETIQKSRTATVGDLDKNGYTYQYANISDVLAAVHTACSTHGLAVTQRLDVLPENRQQIVTVLVDLESGAEMNLLGPIFPVKGEPQATGSQLTYMRRYALVLSFGLNVEDDDGQQAQRAATKPENRTGAETEVRQIVGALTKEDRARFVADFKDVFGVGLSDLPESRHGDALTWAKWWTDDEQTRPEQPETNPVTDEPEEAY